MEPFWIVISTAYLYFDMLGKGLDYTQAKTFKTEREVIEYMKEVKPSQRFLYTVTESYPYVIKSTNEVKLEKPPAKAIKLKGAPK